MTFTGEFPIPLLSDLTSELYISLVTMLASDNLQWCSCDWGLRQHSMELWMHQHLAFMCMLLWWLFSGASLTWHFLLPVKLWGKMSESFGKICCARPNMDRFTFVGKYTVSPWKPFYISHAYIYVHIYALYIKPFLFHVHEWQGCYQCNHGMGWNMDTVLLRWYLTL